MIIDKIFIENNNVAIFGYKNVARPYKNWKELYNILLEMFPSNVYCKIEITRKDELDDEFNYEYYKDSTYENENGFTGYIAKVLVDESVIEVLYSALKHNNYKKVEKNKTLSLKYIE